MNTEHVSCSNQVKQSNIVIIRLPYSSLKEKLENTTETKITTAQVDADKVEELIALIQSYQPDAVLNVALPYQDLTIMDACLACKVDYIDTASLDSITANVTMAGLPRPWSTKRIYTFRQFHASTKSCLLQIFRWKWEISIRRY